MGRFTIPALFILGISIIAPNVSADDYPHPYAKPSDNPPASLSNEGTPKTIQEIMNGGPINNTNTPPTNPTSINPSIKMTITNNTQPGTDNEAAECNFGDFIGRPAAEAKENARFSGRVIRTLGEDDLVRWNYLRDRVTFITNKAGVITKISCG